MTILVRSSKIRDLQHNMFNNKFDQYWPKVCPEMFCRHYIILIGFFVFSGFYLFLQVKFPLNVSGVKLRHYLLIGWGKSTVEVSRVKSRTGTGHGQSYNFFTPKGSVK